MSQLSGFDSDAVGFDSIMQAKRPETSTSTQTTEFAESTVETQTNSSLECASMTDDLVCPNAEYSPANLNAFLKKVVPGILDQLDQNENEYSSDSEEDDIMMAKLLQDIQVDKDVNLGCGDHQTWILGMSWSNVGNSLAVSIGQAHHETWCEHEGLIRMYTSKRSAGDKLVHAVDVSEKSCVTVLQYHPSVALLAYGTAAGEVVIYNLRETGQFDMQLTSPSGCHGSRTVTALQWADSTLANNFLTQILNAGKRRSATDQVLVSAGADGTVNAWQVNANSKVFENIVCFAINKSRDMPAPDISCLDLMKSCPLRSSDENTKDGLFVVGSKTGNLFLCTVKDGKPVPDSALIDPVCDVMESHNACVLDIAFSARRSAVFASVSVDSELRIYDVSQSCPIKVMTLYHNVSCASWLHGTGLLLTGEEEGKRLRVWRAGGELPAAGLEFPGTACALATAAGRDGTRRIAAGDARGLVRVWELPARHVRLTADDLQF